MIGFDVGLIFRSGVIRGLLPFSIDGWLVWMISISLSTMEARGDVNDEPLVAVLGKPPAAGLVIESLDEGKNTLK